MRLRVLKILIFVVFIFSFLNKNLYALEIVVSNSPLKKIVESICIGHKIYQLQKPNTDFHFYEPTFFQWQKIQKADLVVIVGTERWAKKVYNLRKNKETISLTERGEKILDPHLWFDLNRVEILVKKLTQYMISKEVSKKREYQKRAEIFLQSLKKVQEEYQGLKRCKYKNIYVLGHPVFGYLLKDTGIKEITLIKSYYKEEEPSVKTLTEIYNKVKTQRGNIVFLLDPEFERYKNFFEERGIKVIKLWSGGSYYMPGDYIELLRYNLINIKKALSCE